MVNERRASAPDAGHPLERLPQAGEAVYMYGSLQTGIAVCQKGDLSSPRGGGVGGAVADEAHGRRGKVPVLQYPAHPFRARLRGDRFRGHDRIKGRAQPEAVEQVPHAISAVGVHGEPDAPPDGIPYVMVNGVFAVDDGVFQNTRSGSVIRY